MAKDKQTDEEKAASEEEQRNRDILEGNVEPGTADLPEPEPRKDSDSK